MEAYNRFVLLGNPLFFFSLPRDPCPSFTPLSTADGKVSVEERERCLCENTRFTLNRQDLKCDKRHYMTDLKFFFFSFVFVFPFLCNFLFIRETESN